MLISYSIIWKNMKNDIAIQDHWASAYMAHCLLSVRLDLEKIIASCFISTPKKELHFCFPESCWITSLCRIYSLNGLSLTMQERKGKKANLYLKTQHVIQVSWGKVISAFFNASCCSAWELKGMVCSFYCCMTCAWLYCSPKTSPRDKCYSIIRP